MLDNIYAAGHPLHLDEPADRGVDDALVPRRGARSRCSRRPRSTAPACSARCARSSPRSSRPASPRPSLICFIFSWNELLFARVLTATVAADRAGLPDRLRHQPGPVPGQGVRGRRSWSRCRCSSPGSPPRTSWSRACRWGRSSDARDVAAARCPRSLRLARPGRGRPAGYDRGAVTAGIVHFGVGGFHRAHQAMYLDRLMNEGKALDWGICGVGRAAAATRRMRDVLDGAGLPLHAGGQAPRRHAASRG